MSLSVYQNQNHSVYHIFFLETVPLLFDKFRSENGASVSEKMLCLAGDCPDISCEPSLMVNIIDNEQTVQVSRS